jgi:hypothetical protein
MPFPCRYGMCESALKEFVSADGCILLGRRILPCCSQMVVGVVVCVVVCVGVCGCVWVCEGVCGCVWVWLWFVAIL